jgi:glucose-6-phosphate isomerase
LDATDEDGGYYIKTAGPVQPEFPAAPRIDLKTPSGLQWARTMNIPLTATGLEPYAASIADERRRFKTAGLTDRIWNRDHTVWKDAAAEITDRLGWLDAPAAAAGAIDEAEAFAREIRADGFTEVLLLGMGGSSLAPEVFSLVFGAASPGPRLRVLDTTDPAAVLEFDRTLPAGKTLFLVSSKSGTTLETASLMNYFFARTLGRIGRARAGRSFAAITDPGSHLEAEARRLEFRRVFPGDPNIGGRFSVFSAFGFVPAALIGLDVRALISRADRTAAACRRRDPTENPGTNLGIILGTLARAGRDKAVFLLSPEIQALGAWIEQLVAESTGKDGGGILPLVRPTGAPIPGPTPDRVYVSIGFAGDELLAETRNAAIRTGDPVLALTLGEPLDAGVQFYLWEFATAAAGAVLGINPFDQPHVALAKKKTDEALNAFRQSGSFPDETPTAENDLAAFYGEISEADPLAGLRRFIDGTGSDGYFCLQAFLPPVPETAESLRTLAGRIEARTGRPASFDFGPRFLHSTGQLHKGDGGRGVFLQLTAARAEDAPIPSTPDGGPSLWTFGNLIDAQSLGDRQALRDKGRRIARLHFKSRIADGFSFVNSGLARD